MRKALLLILPSLALFLVVSITFSARQPADYASSREVWAATNGAPVTTAQIDQSNADKEKPVSANIKNLTDMTRAMIRAASSKSLLPRLDFFPTNTSNADHAIFYNVYVASKDVERRTYMFIINEQMREAQASSDRFDTVYYNLIGYNGSSRPVCREGLRCKQLRYMSKGGEMDTLQDMHDYCVDRSDANVVYLHNKGSFHFHQSNAKTRRLVTRSALHDLCRLEDEQQICDTCSFNFNYLTTHHVSGNMFSAKCSYIQTLVPPREFEYKKLELFLELLINVTTTANQFKCLHECVMERTSMDELSNWFGLGRYSAETWLFSSPLVEPCFLMTLGSQVKFETGKEEFSPDMVSRKTPTRILNGFHSHMKYDYFQARGKLFEYRYMYNGQEPSKQSWFWKVWAASLATPPMESCDC